MKISFCTTCMNRVEHLKQTLPQNLIDNPNMPGLSVEFVVLNYNSGDDLHEWKTTDPQTVEAMKTGHLVYARAPLPQRFHMSHAKNMAHRLATGDVVCNLDADNYTGSRFAEGLSRLFRQDMNLLITPSWEMARQFPQEERGFGGRVALSREKFLKLGGYDETYQGWGMEDTDLTRRARLAGLKFVRYDDPKHMRVIGHTNDMRAANMFDDPADIKREEEKITRMGNRSGFNKLFHAALNRLPTLIKPIVANEGRLFGLGLVYKGLEESKFSIRSLPSEHVAAFNLATRIAGCHELTRGRINPRRLYLDSVVNRDGGPL